ncbi:MAG: neutral zinc metallopeptidase [Pseudomonadota bacterium]
MRWQHQRRSDNVRNRRGQSSRARGMGGSGLIFMLIRFVFTRFGIGGIAVLAGGYFTLQAMGLNPMAMLAGGGAPQVGSSASPPTSKYDEMIRAVVGSTEDIWADIFEEEGLGDYPEPILNLFSNGVNSACGYAPSDVGPFYCPGDRQIYIDTAFFQDLQRRFNAPGDFPPAYVIAHEVGHHVQTVTGAMADIRQAQSRASKVEKNQINVRMELQADCYAGLWAHRWRQGIEAGDIQEALRTAAAVGDDTIQRQAGQRVTPENFTHGTSAQRQRWFTVGYESGEYTACDTFGVSAAQL